MSPGSTTANSSLVVSYLVLRKAIGVIGLSLPFVLVIGKMAFESAGVQPSISDYYYTLMRDVFVGSLCAIGVFLLSYRGYEPKDDIAGNVACICAIGVALFPTTPDKPATGFEGYVGWIHYTFAAALFLTLAYFSLILFRKTDPKLPMTPRKKKRNTVYLFCGVLILGCIVLLAINALFLGDTDVAKLKPILLLESIAVCAFGVSWLTKGEAILSDIKGETP